jgi:hypothetical protein
MRDRVAAELSPFKTLYLLVLSQRDYFIVSRCIERVLDCAFGKALDRLVFSPLGISGPFIAAMPHDLDDCAWGNQTHYFHSGLIMACLPVLLNWQPGHTMALSAVKCSRRDWSPRCASRSRSAGAAVRLRHGHDDHPAKPGGQILRTHRSGQNQRRGRLPFFPI